MARPNNGHLVRGANQARHQLRDPLQPRRPARIHLIGGAWDGWTRERAKKGRLYLLGHTDSSFTLRVYQQVLDMGEGAVEALEISPARASMRPVRPTPGGGFASQFQSPRKVGSSGGGMTLQQGSDSGDLQAER